MMNYKTNAILLLSFLSLQAVAFPKFENQELIEYFLAKATRISGLPARELKAVPPMYLLSVEELNKEVCPEDPQNCRNLAAVFDDIGYRILIRNDFDLSDSFNPYDYSFVIHELVHFLQYRQAGAEIFKDCTAVYNTELLAYTVQDTYLKEEGDFHRPGTFLRFFYCSEELAHKDYELSKRVWDDRLQNGFWGQH